MYSVAQPVLLPFFSESVSIRGAAIELLLKLGFRNDHRYGSRLALFVKRNECKKGGYGHVALAGK